jgi:hypothetical protein
MVVMIDQKRVEEIASIISNYKEGEKEAKETVAIYSGFIETLEGSLQLYTGTLNPKTHTVLGVLGHYLARKELKSNAEELEEKIKSGILIKNGKRKYDIKSKDFGDIVELLNESDANIGRLFNMYYAQLDELFAGSPIFNEMSGRYKGKH